MGKEGLANMVLWFIPSLAHWIKASIAASGWCARDRIYYRIML